MRGFNNYCEHRRHAVVLHFHEERCAEHVRSRFADDVPRLCRLFVLAVLVPATAVADRDPERNSDSHGSRYATEPFTNTPEIQFVTPPDREPPSEYQRYIKREQRVYQVRRVMPLAHSPP